MPRIAFPAILRRPQAALFGALAVAVVLFQLVYGLRLLNAGDAYWSNPHGDMGQMLAGELAGLRAPWSLPLLTPRTLTAPDPVSLVYTDSIPWLTAILKLTHLGRVLSLLGTFLFLAWLAQAAAMYALLRACGVQRRATLFAGAVLALLVPAWLARQLGHTALSGHALQILALALAAHGARRGTTGRGVAAFIALAVLAAGVHAYHLPPITLMFAAALGADLLQRRPGAWRRAFVGGPAYLAAVAAAAWALGYFVGRGASGGVAALGYYEMNILAPVWPQASTLAGHKWTGNWFSHVFDPTGGQLYEGFNYLGAGVLLLLTAAALLLWRERRRPQTPAPSAFPTDSAAGWRRWTPLALALAVLALYACGLNGWLGPVRVWAITLPDKPWMEPLALFRCHGRFFWTVGYALLAGGLTVVDRAAGPRLRAALLAAALALQAADMSGMLLALNDRFSRPEALRLPEGLADSRALEGRELHITPHYFCLSAVGQEVVRQLTVAAQRRHGATDTAAVARPPLHACPEPEPDALLDAGPGDPRITVLLGSEGVADTVTSRFRRRSDCRRAELFWLCGRGLAGAPGLTPVSGDALAAPTHADLDLSISAHTLPQALLSGWSAPGELGVWSEGPRAVLRLPAPTGAPRGYRLVLEALGLVGLRHPTARAWISLNGERLEAWRLDSGYRTFVADLPPRLIRPGAPLDIVIDTPDAISPNELTPGAGDPRRLGIGVRRVMLMH